MTVVKIGNSTTAGIVKAELTKLVKRLDSQIRWCQFAATSTLIAFVSSHALAGEQCIPKGAIICTIDESGSGYAYVLSTTVQDEVTRIEFYDNEKLSLADTLLEATGL